MTRYLLAIPAGILLLSVSIPAVSQTFADNPDMAVSPRMAQSQGSMPAASEPPAIVVRPELTEEQMGDLYMARKDYREAALVYKKLSDQNPRNPVYLNKLGISLHQQSALALALKYYEKAYKADPQYADAQNNIGTVWYQKKKYNKAIRAYQKAIAIRPDMAVLFSNLGYAYFGDKKYEQAIASFRQALSIDPQLFEHKDSRNGSVLQDRSVGERGKFYFLLAKSYAEAGNLERCLIYLRKAKDEGYKDLAAAKTDPAFSAVLKDPAIQEVLTPKAETAQR
jgi:tetratricopeptide (TPR) repeat protein